MSLSPSQLADGIAHDVMPRVHDAADHAEALMQRGVDAVVQSKHTLQRRGRQAQDATLAYIQREPIKSVLMAAATGAAVMALISAFSRRG